MTHMEDHDLGVSSIDRVKDQIRVANGGKHANAGFVGKVSGFRKILKQARNGLDAINYGDCGRAIAFVDIREDLVDVR
jgi:hypothetical protein